MLMKDKQKTRIQLSKVNAFYADKDVNYMASQSWPTIHLVINGFMLVLNYHNKEDRDSDIKMLDELTGTGYM